MQLLLEVSLGVQGLFFTLKLFLNKEKMHKLCQKCHYVSIHCHHIGLQNSCSIQDVCHIQDNITFNVSSILQMHDSEFILYLKSTACQYLLSNKKSVFKLHSYKTWLLIKCCQMQDVQEWQFRITMYVHFHAIWIHCTVKTFFSKKLHKLRYTSMYKT